MKRVILSIVAILAMAFSASAQQKGEQYVGLNLGYETGKSTVEFHANSIYDIHWNEKVTERSGDDVGFGLEYGYFVANNLLVKAHVGYGFEKLDEDISHSFNITPGLAYYVRLANHFYYTPNLLVGYGLSSTKQTNDSYLTLHGLVAEVQPLAVEFRPAKRFAMTVSLASLQFVYLSGKLDAGEQLSTTVDTSGVAFSLLANAQVGFKLYF